MSTLAALARLTRSRSALVEEGRPSVGGGEETVDVTTTVEEEPEEPTNPRYSTAMTLEYYLVRDNLIASVWGGETQGQTSVINDFINDFVERRLDDGRMTAFPTADQLLNDPDFVNGAWATRFRAAGSPTNFVYTDENGGRFLVSTLGDASITPLPAGSIGFNPFTGSQNTPLTFDQTSTGAPSRQEETTQERRKFGGTLAGKAADAVPSLSENPELIKPSQTGSTLPVLNTSDLGALLNSGRSGGGGGGGGGGGRAAMVFDAEQLKEQTRATYRRWYRQDPVPERLDSIVNEYSRKANAFWIGKGGRLDFDTFMRERLREEPQYTSMFKFRPPSIDEDTFIMDFANQVGAIGLRAGESERQIAAAAQSGGSAGSQALRVSRTREASLQAPFARRLGSAVQQLGRLG